MVPSFGGAQPFVQFCKGHHEEQFCYIFFFNLDQRDAGEDVVYEILLIYRSCCPLKHLCHFGGWHPGEHFCKIIMNLDQWISWICRFKTFVI